MELADQGAALQISRRHKEALEELLVSRAWLLAADEDKSQQNLLARLQSLIGEAYRCLNDFPKAIAAFELGLGYEARPNTEATLRNNMALALRSLGRHHEALNNFQRAIELWGSEDTPNVQQLAWIAGAEDNLGNLYGVLGDHHRSLARHRKSIQVRESLLEIEPTQEKLAELAVSYSNLSITLGEQDYLEESLEAAKTAREYLLEVQAELPLREELALAELNLACAHTKLENFDYAVNHCRASILIYRELQSEDFPGTEFRVAQAQSNLSTALFESGQHKLAIDVLLRAIRDLELLNLDPKDVRNHHIAAGYSNLAYFYSVLEEKDSALGAHQIAVAKWEEVIPVYPAGKTELVAGLMMLSELLRESGSLVARREILQRAKVYLDDLVGTQGQLQHRRDRAFNEAELGGTILMMGRAGEALDYLERACRWLEQVEESDALEAVTQLTALARREVDL